jgi:hypothetical protein
MREQQFNRAAQRIASGEACRVTSGTLERSTLRHAPSLVALIVTTDQQAGRAAWVELPSE